MEPIILGCVVFCAAMLVSISFRLWSLDCKVCALGKEIHFVEQEIVALAEQLADLADDMNTILTILARLDAAGQLTPAERAIVDAAKTKATDADAAAELAIANHPNP